MLPGLCLLVLAVSISACSKQSDVFLPYDLAADLPEDHADAPADQLLIEARESFTYVRQFPADAEYRLQLPGSVGIRFPMGEWADSNGEQVQGLLTVRIVTAITPGQLLLSNVSSLSDDQLLSMLGAVRIEFFQEDRLLHPTGTYKIELEMPLSEDTEGWQLYSVFPGTNNWVALGASAPATLSVKGYETGEPVEVLQFVVEPEKWLAVAKPLADMSGQSSTIYIATDSMWDANQLAIFASLPTVHAVKRFSSTDASGTFLVGDLPAGYPLDIYALGIDQAGIVHLAHSSLSTVADTTTIQLTLQPVTLSALLGLLE